MSSDVRALMQRVSWQAEKLFRKRGSFGLIWALQNRDGRRQTFETGCTAKDIDDYRALDGLRWELRNDFAVDGVACYAVAYMARATVVTQATIVNRDTTSSTRAVVVIEGHDAQTHMCATREIIAAGRLAALQPVEAGACCFASLLEPRGLVPGCRDVTPTGEQSIGQ